tara:strand:- start:8464 stop:9261 length:798 start_codon:yes stop_codon:yes gene_type:complete
MAYFLGRDVEVAITTEHNNLGVVIETSSDELVAGLVDFNDGTSTGENEYNSTADKANLFAGPRACINGNGPWGDLKAESGEKCPDNTTVLVVNQTWNNEPDNLTAIDLSLGVMDEDVAFIGQRNVLKAEVKKENTISITRKKKDSMFDAVFNGARFGVAKDSSDTGTTAPYTENLFDGLRAPDFADCGYRVYIRFKESTTADTGEVFILRNCYITEHTVTMAADSTQEETLTFMSYVDPLITDGVNPTHSNNSNAYVEATPTTEL